MGDQGESKVNTNVAVAYWLEELLARYDAMVERESHQPDESRLVHLLCMIENMRMKAELGEL